MNKFSESEWISAWLSHAQGHHINIKLPLMPSIEVQKLTNNKSGYETIKKAIPFYKILSKTLQSLDLNSSPVILDLGAGWGRFSALLSQHGYEQYAVDVDETLVKAGQEFLPFVKWSKIESGEPIDYPDEKFDLIFSNSVLSHLSKESHLHTVNQVSRLLKPGGIFIATTLSEDNLKNTVKNDTSKKWITSILGDLSICFSKLSKNEFVYAPTARWKDYGIAVIPTKWLSNHWPDKLEILETIEDNPNFQSVTVAKKV